MNDSSATKGSGGDPRALGFGVALVAGGVGLLLLALSMDPVLFAMLLQVVLVAVGAALTVLGGVFLVRRRTRPLTPVLSWSVPMAASIAVVALPLSGLGGLGGASSVLFFPDPVSAQLVGASFGAPVGAALRRDRRWPAAVAGSAGAVTYLEVATSYYGSSGGGTLGQVGWMLGFVLAFAVPATVAGWALTPARGDRGPPPARTATTETPE